VEVPLSENLPLIYTATGIHSYQAQLQHMMAGTTDSALHHTIGVITLGVLTILMGVVLWIILIGHIPVQMPISAKVTAEQVLNPDGIPMLSVHHYAGPPFLFASGENSTDSPGYIRGRMYASYKNRTWEVVPGIGRKAVLLNENSTIFIYADESGLFLTDSNLQELHASYRMQEGEWILRITDGANDELIYIEDIKITDK